MSVRDHLAACHRMISRTHALRAVCVAALVSVYACTNSSKSELLPDYSTVLALKDGAPAEVTRNIPAGTYLIEVLEDEIDVRVLVSVAEPAAELEDRVPRHGTIYKVVSLAEPADLRIQVRSADHATKQGRVSLRIAHWVRPADEKPGDLELGYLAFGAAGEQTALGTPEAWTRAADKLSEAVTHFEAADDDPARARAAYALANIQYGVRNEWAGAIRATEIAADAYESEDDEVGVQNAATLRAAAEIEIASYMNAGTQRAEQSALYAAADRRLTQAGEFFVKRDLLVRAHYAVNMRAVRAVHIGEYAAAELLLARAVDFAQTNRDTGEMAKSLGNLAAVHNRLGFMAKAASEYEALLPLVDEKTQPYDHAALLGNLGFTLIALGDFDRALELHLKALAIYTKIGDEDERATELAALGGLYFRMGDAVRSLDTLRAAILAQEQVSDSRGLASTLRVAGNVSSVLGQHAEALDYLRKSAQIDANPHSVARTSVLIAAQLRAAGDVVAAEAELHKPLQSSNALVRANALEERARLRLDRKNTSGAIEDLRAADDQYAELGLEFNRIDTSTALSQALLATRDIAGASAAADQALAIVGRIRVKSGNPEWRARFLSSRYSPFEARIAVDLADAAGGNAAAAWRGFRTAEDVRARSLADEMALHATRAARTQDSEDAVLRARLTSQQLRLEARIQRQDADAAGTLALQRAIQETRAQIDSQRLRSGGVTANQSTLPESLREVQQALPGDTAVLAYFVGDLTSHAWLLTKQDLRHTELPGRNLLEPAISAAIGAPHRRSEAASATRKLGALLFGKLLDGLTEKRLLLIADGPLNGVPFAALPLTGIDEELLLDRFVLGYAPSLALAMTGPRASRASTARVAVVSDPVYAPDDRRLRLAAGGTRGNLRGPPAASTNNLTRLPYSALEASAVAKAFGANETIQLAGFDANADRVLQLPSSELAVLHFATHAVSRKDAPEQSALYLSEYAPDGTLLPTSRLSAGDISRSGLRADVVVLSGCATGDGSELRGEGVLGLTYGFLANGSRSVVAALWPIEDASTARFMNEFYRAYRVSGRAAEALRVAQLRTRADAASVVWASFVVRANGFP
ncbi:MAG TPA: CHAT domain-containing tetratricopeptide repeat protein [Steroidobacteraceae bacterium]|nr:CHAT domain-containing tetratricopeptide repeat protein [Steroidobacteraceae bacterium]